MVHIPCSLGHRRFLVAASSWIFTAHRCRYTGRSGSLNPLLSAIGCMHLFGARDVPIYTVKHLVQNGIPNAVYMALSGCAALFCNSSGGVARKAAAQCRLAGAHDCSPSSSSQRLHSWFPTQQKSPCVALRRRVDCTINGAFAQQLSPVSSHRSWPRRAPRPGASRRRTAPRAGYREHHEFAVEIAVGLRRDPIVFLGIGKAG
jgi:hypothetical protein